jgi:hypothetical protein
MKFAEGGPTIKDSDMVASPAPGLGMTLGMAVLGEPVRVVEG